MKTKIMRYLVLTILVLISSNLLSQSLPQKIDVDNQIIHNDGYILSYNETCEQPNWVYYVITPEDLNGTKVKRKNVFKKDTLVPTGSATLEDYKGSGYDRGHLKASADESCDREQMDATFKMSNMSPQNPSFNRGIWKKLENYVRNETLKSDSILVITGGVLNEPDKLEKIGENKVCVPDFFYKVIYIYKDGKTTTYAFLFKNEKSKESLSSFRVEVGVLEKFIGYTF